MKEQEILQQNIKYFRKKLGLSQEELSERCDYSNTYVGKIERGDRSPSLDTLVRIASALDVELIRLFDPLESELTPTGSLGDPGSASPYDLMIRRFNYLVGHLDPEGILLHLRHLPWNATEQSMPSTGNQCLWETDRLSLSDRLAEALKTGVERASRGESTHINLIVDEEEPTAGVADALVYPIETDDSGDRVGFEFFWPRILGDDRPRPLSETDFDCKPGNPQGSESS
jgi:transcriptional regulator with XRE-family HTH domain